MRSYRLRSDVTPRASCAGERCRNHGERSGEAFDDRQVDYVRSSIARIVKKRVVADDGYIPPTPAVNVAGLAARHVPARKALVDSESGFGHRPGHHRLHFIVGCLQAIAEPLRRADIGTEMNPRFRA